MPSGHLAIYTTLTDVIRKGRKVQIRHDEVRYRKRHKIENSFTRLKDWRRVATRYDRCPKVFLSACALAAVVMFWL
jgi:transposase